MSDDATQEERKEFLNLIEDGLLVKINLKVLSKFLEKIQKSF